jgi:CDP-diacylglycerol--glycerol-3-phosphate 3-phosphatidyltransferase
VTGHPPTHGRRAGAARADGPRTGEPPAADAHSGDDHAGEQGWAALHGGIRPSALVRLWLRGVQRVAAGPVARVSPDVLSVAGVAAAGGAAVVAAQGGRWPLVAAALVVLAGVLDGLDGAVALHTGRARPLGAVVDAVADRVGDLLLVATLAVLGAPPAWCVAAGALTLLHEYLRARAGAAGMPGVGALTVAERPTRLVLVTVACLGAGTLPGGTPLTGWDWATVCAIGWVMIGAVGLVQLSRGVARTTPRHFPDDDPT